MRRALIRPIRLSDIATVYEIEQESFTKPWKLPMFIEELGHPDSIAFAAETNEEIVGYIFLRKLVDEAHIMTFAVDSAHRLKGIARRLLKTALNAAVEAKCNSIRLEVRASNEHARRLYEKLGFADIGRRAGYYDTPVEDAVIMALGLDP